MCQSQPKQRTMRIMSQRSGTCVGGKTQQNTRTSKVFNHGTLVSASNVPRVHRRHTRLPSHAPTCSKCSGDARHQAKWAGGTGLYSGCLPFRRWQARDARRGSPKRKNNEKKKSLHAGVHIYFTRSVHHLRNHFSFSPTQCLCFELLPLQHPIAVCGTKNPFLRSFHPCTPYPALLTPGVPIASRQLPILLIPRWLLPFGSYQ